MGWPKNPIRSVTDAVKRAGDSVRKNPVETLIGGLNPGTIGAGMVGKNLLNRAMPKPPAPEAPPTDDRLAQVKKEQQLQADQFRRDLPKYQMSMGTDLAATSKAGLARELANVNLDANRRGLLYSGIRQGGAARARNEEAQGLQQGLIGLRQGLDDQANELDANALQTGFGMQRSNQSAANIAYQQALQNMQGRRQMLNSLLGAGGTVAGAGLAGRGQGGMT